MPAAGSGNTHVYIQWTRAITVYLGCGLAYCNYRGMIEEVLVVLVFLAGEVVVVIMAKDGSASLSYCTALLSLTIIGDTDSVFNFISLVWNFPCSSAQTLPPNQKNYSEKLESGCTRFTPKEKRTDNTGIISIGDSMIAGEGGWLIDWLCWLCCMEV